MQALLLLAGRSRRFWPLTEKSLFPLCGKTLAEHQVETLKKGGCKNITLVVGAHNKEEMQALFPKLSIIEQEDLDLGMQGACLSALPTLKKESALIVSGNDVIDPGAIAMLTKEATKKGVDGAILAYKVSRYFPGGYLTIEKGRVTSIVEKPGEGNEPSDCVNIVAHVHNDASALLTALKSLKSQSDDGYEKALDSLLTTKNYRAVEYTGYWQAVKYPWHLLHLLPHMLGIIKKPSIHKTAKIHKTAVVEGNVVIEEGVRILPHASIIGPCFIGKGSIIGNNALVRGSSIGEKCVIGYNTEVKGSILAGPVWTHMTYLGDSIVGRNVSFGGGTMTGNLRLDEGEISSMADGKAIPTGLTKLGAIIGDGCRFGIQIGINPGVKIGSGCFVAGGVYVTEDIGDAKFVRMKDGKIDIRENRTVAPGMEERKKYFR